MIPRTVAGRRAALRQGIVVPSCTCFPAEVIDTGVTLVCDSCKKPVINPQDEQRAAFRRSYDRIARHRPDGTLSK